MKSTLRTSLLALALGGTAGADALFPIPPNFVESVHDEPIDGQGDSSNPAPLVRLDGASEDRVVAEFDVSANPLPVYTDITIDLRLVASNPTDVGPRGFDFVLYPGDGVASLSDFQAPGTVVGSVIYHPPQEPSVNVSLDVKSEVELLVAAGFTNIGLRVQSSTSPNPGNELDVPSVRLIIADCPPQTWSTYCFGDGSGSPCPCGNTGGPGLGCANSATQGAYLGALGVASVGTPGGFQLDVALAPPNRPGLFLDGSNSLGGGNPVGHGLLCLSQNTHRFGLGFTSATGTIVSTLDIAAATGAQWGDTRYYQFWYRDPAGPCGGVGFNFTNGLVTTWLP